MPYSQNHVPIRGTSVDFEGHARKLNVRDPKSETVPEVELSSLPEYALKVKGEPFN